MKLRRKFVDPRHVQRATTEASRECTEPAFPHLRQEEVVLVREPLVVPPNLPDHAVLPRTVRTLRLVLRQTPVRTPRNLRQHESSGEKDEAGLEGRRTAGGSCGCT